MKTLTVLCLLCAAAYAFPAESSEESSESEYVHPLTRKGMPSVVEVDVGDSDDDSFFFPSFYRPFFVNPFPQFKFGGFPSLFPSSLFGWTNFFNRVPSDAKVTNATSNVKVVDGHKVTVNTTTYENEKNGAVYKYEVIEVTRLDKSDEEGGEKSTEETVKPDGAEPTTKKAEESAEETSTVKNDNNSLDNEIFREEWPERKWTPSRRRIRSPKETAFDNHNRVASDYVDLSNDIRVNKLAEQAAIESGHFAVPEDVEIFAVPNVIDLSDDIRVNKLAEQAAIESGYFAVPEDVEIFVVVQQYRQKYYAPERNEFRHELHPLGSWQLKSRNIYPSNYDRLSHQLVWGHGQDYNPRGRDYYRPRSNIAVYQPRGAYPYYF